MFILTTQQKCLHNFSSKSIPFLIGCRNISLKSQKRREYLYGISPCFAAVNAGRREIFKIYMHEKLKDEPPKREHLKKILEEAQAKEIPIVYKGSGLLDRLCAGHLHQNVVIEAGKLHFLKMGVDYEPVWNNQFWLALDKIHDPMNFGAILRSAAYFGVDKIIVSEKNCCGLTSAVSKASSGAMEWIPVHGVSSMEKFLKHSKRKGWDVIGSRSRESGIKETVFPCEDVEIKNPSILVIGNEGFGLDEEITKVCTQMITVDSNNPFVPYGLDSLNVSVATGIMLHSLIKDQRVRTKENILG